MYGNEETKVTLTRQQLYERVWSEPTSKIAREFGLSDVAIGKICRKFRVPKPQPGYWARVQNGFKPRPVPLPLEKDPALQNVKISVRHDILTRTPMEASVQVAMTAEQLPENKIVVPDSLENPHPLIKRTRTALRAATQTPYATLYSRDDNCLEISVSRASVDRALRIADALLKALESRGHSVAVLTKNQKRLTEFNIGGEKIVFSMREEVIRVERELTVKEKSELKTNPHAYILNKYSHKPTGSLTIHVETDFWAQGYRKRWGDGNKHRLEDRLNTLVAGLLNAAYFGKQARLAREKQKQEWADRENRAHEEEKRRGEEKARVDHLDRVLGAWKKSKEVRELVSAVEAAEKGRGRSIDPESDLGKWLKWAREHADAIDPTFPK